MLVDGLRVEADVGMAWVPGWRAGCWLAAAGAQAPVPATAQASAAGSAGREDARAWRGHGSGWRADSGSDDYADAGKGPAVTATSGSDGTYSAVGDAGDVHGAGDDAGVCDVLGDGAEDRRGAGMTLDAKLQIGVQTQVITVDANSVQLSVDPDSNASATVMTGKDLDALSDDPDELSSELTALAGPSAGPNGGQIYVDGFTGGQLPPKSSIREIRINQNPFSAQYDQLGYGRVEVFTKPGTDKLHGNFQMNGNPSQFNSANPLATGYQPPYHTIFMFGNLTGPLNKRASYNIGGSLSRDPVGRVYERDDSGAAGGSTTLVRAGRCGVRADAVPGVDVFPADARGHQSAAGSGAGREECADDAVPVCEQHGDERRRRHLTLPSTAYNTSSLSNILQMSDTQTFSSKLINETRFEYEREHATTTPLSTAPRWACRATLRAADTADRSRAITRTTSRCRTIRRSS